MVIRAAALSTKRKAELFGEGERPARRGRRPVSPLLSASHELVRTSVGERNAEILS